MKTERIVLVNQVSELEKITLKLEELSEKWEIPPRIIMEINLALEELFTNVVFYAYHDKDLHHITVDFLLDESNILQLKLEDDGKPFDLTEKDSGEVTGLPVEERPIGGLGIHLVRKMMDNVEYQRHEKNNVVILTKKF